MNEDFSRLIFESLTKLNTRMDELLERMIPITHRIDTVEKIHLSDMTHLNNEIDDLKKKDKEIEVSITSLAGEVRDIEVQKRTILVFGTLLGGALVGLMSFIGLAWNMYIGKH